MRRGFLLVVLVILQFLDIATTNTVLSLGGQEANPVMAPIIHHPILPLLVKLAGVGVLAYFAFRCSQRFATRLLTAATLGYLTVVGWNLYVIQGAT